MQRISKLAMVAVALVMLAGVGLAYEIPAYAQSKYNTYMTNAYSWAGWSRYTPYYRSWGTVNQMPTFMVDSFKLGGAFTACTVKFYRAIAMPFICASASTVTATIKLFRDYDSGTPLNFSAGFDSAALDSLWFDFPGYMSSAVVTYAAADSNAFILVGGFALPVP